MAKIQCKMCGGQVELPDGVTAGECPYCGSLTTFPKINTEQRERLYSRAEHFRHANNFDKAVAAYESILDLDGTDPEAWWGLLISKYGIEYVEDPVTRERIPTCHRVQFDSILVDPDYLNVLKYAVGYDRDIYEKEAKRISEIQKNILRISAQEKPYDVFICYKETTEGGSRTKDSVLAQDIYTQLVNQRLKVFFARITLEDKLGQQYEPYIFAALNSSKVMLVIGSKKEHFEAVWVKNEWSRFLALKKKDPAKLLIPCFVDMDAYDLPEELSMFQCQDMNKIGFMQDLVRGILKVVTPAGNEAKSVVSGGASDARKIMKRISIMMTLGDWSGAKEYCSKLLDSDPENPELYLMMCMITLQVQDEAALRKSGVNLSINRFFQIALKFARPERRCELEEIQRAAMFDFHLWKCMKTHHVSGEAELLKVTVPLSEDQDFRAALSFALPERRQELEALAEKQRESLFSLHYLKKSLEANGVSDESELASIMTPLSEDENFRMAWSVASPEEKQRLERLQAKQVDCLLDTLKATYGVRDLVQVPVPIAQEPAFQTAMMSATPERQAELQLVVRNQTDTLLKVCMDAHGISSEEDLKQCPVPLLEDKAFMNAFDNAPPERRKMLQEIVYAQSDFFLRKCMKTYFFSNPDRFHLCLWVRLEKDFAFNAAKKCASPEQLKKLNEIAAKQKRMMNILDGILLFFLAIIIVTLVLLAKT